MTLDGVADLRDGSDAPAKEKRLKRHRSAAFTEEYLASCLVELRRGGSGTVPIRASSTRIRSPEKSEEPAVIPTLEAPEPSNKNHATSTLLRSQDDHTDYQCSVCGEAFLTYQALGGHKTIHRPELSTVTVTVTVPDEPSAASSTDNAPKPDVSAPSNPPRDKAHVCFICHRSFPKGQSLGGHMRRHYNGRIRSSAKTTVPNITTFFPSSSEDGVSIQRYHHRDFDLNFSPPPEPAEHEPDLELGLNF